MAWHGLVLACLEGIGMAKVVLNYTELKLKKKYKRGKA
jgi:hypothetical protein